MKRATSWLVLSAAALAAGLVTAAEPGGGAPGAAARADWPLWDGKESVADYAKRAGIRDVQVELDLGRSVVGPEDVQMGLVREGEQKPGSNVVMKLTLIPAGKFMMGARGAEVAVIEGIRTVVREHEEGIQVHEAPQREVTISKPFYMSVYEVTQEQYLQIMKQIRTANNASLQSRGRTLPIDALAWGDAAEFCKRVSTLTGRTVTLPTEAQWEYACRAGSTERFCFGDDAEELYKYANYDRKNKWANRVTEHDDGFDGLAPVGSFKPNNFGLYDMHGNVYEWVSDWMGDDDVSRGKRGHLYKNEGTLDPTGPEPTWPAEFGYHKVTRGGNFRSAPDHCRSAARCCHSAPPSGIRVVMALQ